MNKIPGHTLPTYSEDSREDALFHYTTGSGLIGILSSNEIWNTAYYCANDESELSVCKGVLVHTFRNRGVDIRDYADKFEQTIISFALHVFCVYITCFCKPSSKEDFHHGLLSQWRGYGMDGG